MYLLLLPEWWGHSIWYEADMEKTNLYKYHEQYYDEKSQSYCVHEQQLWLSF